MNNRNVFVEVLFLLEPLQLNFCSTILTCKSTKVPPFILTLSSTRKIVSVCTTCLNVKKYSIMPTQLILALRKNATNVVTARN